MTREALIESLKPLVEPGKLLDDAASLDAYGKDWTKHFAPAPLAIVFPKSVEQVQAIVRWANQHKVGLVRRAVVPGSPPRPWRPTAKSWWPSTT